MGKAQWVIPLCKVYDIHSVQENGNVQVFDTYRHLASWPWPNTDLTFFTQESHRLTFFTGVKNSQITNLGSKTDEIFLNTRTSTSHWQTCGCHPRHKMGTSVLQKTWDVKNTSFEREYWQFWGCHYFVRGRRERPSLVTANISTSFFPLNVCISRNANRCFIIWWLGRLYIIPYHHHHQHQFLNREGRWGTTDDFATSFLHLSLFSTALWDLLNSRPVPWCCLPTLFLCPPCILPPFTVPCKMVLARPDERETWPYHCSLRLFTIVRRSSCGPIACWILVR